MRQQEIPSLNPQMFASSIRREPAFLQNLPKKQAHELDPADLRQQRQRAIARGALSIADKLEEKHGGYDLDANLYRLVGQLHDFFESSNTVNSLRESYSSTHLMPPQIKRRFYDNKTRVTEFNHTLREVINAGASRFNFNQLLGFMTNMYAATGNRDDLPDLHREARRALVGMRNEMAFEQVLIASGYDYAVGSVDQDAEATDFIINGVPIDIKASIFAAERAKQNARRGGYDDGNILWSHIEPQDYNGELTLSFEKTDEVLARIKPELDRVVNPHTALRA